MAFGTLTTKSEKEDLRGKRQLDEEEDRGEHNPLPVAFGITLRGFCILLRDEWIWTYQNPNVVIEEFHLWLSSKSCSLYRSRKQPTETHI